jgi:hypothetical protein
MKVFLSWSGERGLEVAKVFKEYIPYVIQSVTPYFSSSDIDKGARWSTDIAKELEEANFGILCVTKDNLESQWLNFEAGALSKAIDKAKVCPFLFDLKPSDISNSPILQFQMTNYEKDDIYKLFQSINCCLNEKKLEEATLDKTFATFWDQIDEALKRIPSTQTTEPKREKQKLDNTIIEEMLELLRYQQIILRNPDQLLPSSYLEAVINKTTSRSAVKIRERVPFGLVREYRLISRELSSIMNNNDIHTEDYVLMKNRIGQLLDITDTILSYVETEKPKAAPIATKDHLVTLR